LTKLVNGKQIRSARGLLGWSQSKLAQESGLSINSVAKFEREEVNTTTGTLITLTTTLENAGIEFWNYKDGRFGVMFIPSQTDQDKNED